MIEADGINAYISTENINLNKKFNLKYEEDTYYDMYLNYDYFKNNIYIVIVQVSDESRKYYRYNPNREERKILMDKLKKYIKETYNQTIEEFIQESEKNIRRNGVNCHIIESTNSLLYFFRVYSLKPMVLGC